MSTEKLKKIKFPIQMALSELKQMFFPNFACKFDYVYLVVDIAS